VPIEIMIEQKYLQRCTATHLKRNTVPISGKTSYVIRLSKAVNLNYRCSSTFSGYRSNIFSSVSGKPCCLTFAVYRMYTYVCFNL